MDLWEAIEQGFGYDLCANRLWLDCLLRKGAKDPDMSVFRHILAAQEIWLSRCRGASPTAMPNPEATEGTLQELHDGWIETLAAKKDDPVIAFKRLNGEAQALSLSAIARRVINHGTYHRGELRGLCRAKGDEDFPETDLAGYYFQPGVVR